MRNSMGPIGAATAAMLAAACTGDAPEDAAASADQSGNAAAANDTLTGPAIQLAADGEDVLVLLNDDLEEGVLYAPRRFTAVRTDGPIGVVMTGNSEGANTDERTGGVSIKLPDAWEQGVAGRTVVVSILARSADGSEQPYKAAYSTFYSGDSGWRDMIAGAALTESTFEYEVADIYNDSGEYVGIMPDPNEDDIGIVVQRVSVRLK